MRTRNAILVWVALALGLTTEGAEGQKRSAGVLSFEPYVGWFADAYDVGADGKTGPIGGVRIGYDVGRRGRLVGTLGLGSSSDVASVPSGAQDYWVYGNRWLMTTAGAEYDVIADGPTAVALGLQAGAGWRKVLAEDQVGTPANPGEFATGGYSFYDVVVPSLSVRQRLSRRTSITFALTDYVFDVLEAELDHSPGLSVGVSLR